GGVDVDRGGGDGLGRHHVGIELAYHAIEGVLRDVGDHQFGAFGGQAAAEIVADVADTLHRDAQAAQTIDAETVLRRGLDALIDAVGGGGGGIADAAGGDARDVRGLLGHDLDVGHRDA